MPPAYEVLLLNTAVPQIQAAQSGDTYVVPRDIAFSAALTLSAGTANGVPYLSSPGKVLTTGSALTFDGTNLLNDQSTASPIGIRLRNGSTSTSAGTRVAFEFGGTTTGYIGNQFDGGDFNTQYMAANKHIWYRGVSDAMILTSTGLGIGTNNPAAKLQVLGSGQGTIFGSSSAQNFYSTWQYNSTNVGYIGNGASIVGAAAPTDFGLTAFTGGKLWLGTNNGASYAVIDSSGNLGLGVTPSAWGDSGVKAFDVGAGASFAGSSGDAGMIANAYYNGSNWIYKISSLAVRYQQLIGSGAHAWFTAPSGTAGNAISFSQAMTLDASGNLKLGGTADRATTAGTNHLDIFNGTAPVGTLANGISLYSSSGEAYVMDAAGNATLFSPHDAVTNEWIFRSKHTPTGKVLKIDVERLLKFVNDHFGLDAVHEFIED